MNTRTEGGRRLDLGEIDETTTILAERLEMLGEAIRRLLNGRLKEETVIVLIRESLPKGMKLDKAQIKAVLDAAQSLGTRYTRRV
jgi:hypothetical protein